MSNLLKSKIFLGIMIVAVLAIGAFTVVGVSQVSAADYGTVTLRQGSTGPAVMEVQALVGADVDGKYGPMTAAAVRAWQASNGLVADAIFGPASRAKALEVGVAPVQGNCPTGYVTITPVAPLFATCGTAPVEQGACPTGYVVVAPVAPTFATCQATETPVVVDETLTGGAGDLTATELSSPSSAVKVGEGAVATKVYGVEYEADANSDLKLTSVKITLLNGGTGSKKLDRYAKSVSVWYNSVKVGSADVSEFSESANTYTKSINLSGVIIKAGTIGKVYFAMDAIADIDSGNTGSTYNTWTLTVSKTVYLDASGVTTSDTTASLANTIVFDTLANTGDVELKVNLSGSTVSASTVKVSTSADTNQVELMKFTMKAQNSAMLIDQIPVLFTGTGTAASDLDQLTSNVTLVIGEDTFNETLATSNTATATINFDNLDISVPIGTTITGTIYADVNDIDTGFAEGDSLKAEITSALVVALTTNYIDVEDSNGDQLAAGDRTGSAMGNAQVFRSTGVNVVMGTTVIDKTFNDAGDVTSVKYTIPVTVTSFGNTLYTGQAVQLATIATGTTTSANAFALAFEKSSAPTTAVLTCTSCVYTLATSDAVIESNGYRLDDGLARHFTITVDEIAPPGTAGSYRVQLEQIRTFTEATLTTGASNSDLTPTASFETGYQYIES